MSQVRSTSRRAAMLALASLTVVVASGCHRGEDEAGSATVAVRLRDLGQNISPSQLPAISSPVAEGSAPASKLSSLAYLIGQIQVCENLKVDSQGSNAAEGCVDVYRLGDVPDGADFGPAAARADPRYINILDPNQRQALTTPMPVPNKSYTFGIVRWVGPAKVAAEVPLADHSATLYTHDGDLDPSDQSTQAPDLTVGPATEALAAHAIQESWFQLFTPLDLRAGGAASAQDSPLLIDLAFDADALVGGSHLAPVSPSLVDAGGYSIFVPPPVFNPLPAVDGQPVRVETYILRQSQLTAAPFDLRVSIYVRNDQPDTLLSLDLRGSRVAGTAANPSLQRVAFVDEDPAGLTLLNAVYKPMVTGLKRGQNKGDVSRATLPCNGVLSALVAAGCTSGEAQVDVELAEITLLAP